MPAWDDQTEAETTQGFKPSCCEGAAGANKLSAQPCGCDPGCKPKPYVCAWHAATGEYPQDKSAVSSVLGDTCPRCGTPLEHLEGLERDYPFCPACR